MGVRRCAVEGCKSNSINDISVHAYPKDGSHCQKKWMEFMKKCCPHYKNKLGNNYGVCSKHFDQNCFRNLKQFLMGYARALHLYRGAYPTIVDGAANEIFQKDEISKKSLWEMMDDGTDETIPSTSVMSSDARMDSSLNSASDGVAHCVDDGNLDNVLDVSVTEKVTSDETQESAASSVIMPLSESIHGNRPKNKGKDETISTAVQPDKEQRLASKRLRKPAKHDLKRVRRCSSSGEEIECVASDPAMTLPANDLLNSPALTYNGSCVEESPQADAYPSSPLFSFAADGQIPAVIPEIREQAEPYIKPEPEFGSDTGFEMPFPQTSSEPQPSLMEDNLRIKKEKKDTETYPSVSSSANEDAAVVRVKKESKKFPSGDVMGEDHQVCEDPMIMNIRTVEGYDMTGSVNHVKQREERFLSSCGAVAQPAVGGTSTRTSAHLKTAGGVKASYFTNVFKSMYAMQKLGKFCDFTINIRPATCDPEANTACLKVHKSLFGTASKRVRCCRKDFIFLECNHTLESLHSVTEFVYTGCIKGIAEQGFNNVMATWSTAIVLQVSKCVSYVVEQRPDVCESIIGSSKKKACEKDQKSLRLRWSLEDWLRHQCDNHVPSSDGGDDEDAKHLRLLSNSKLHRSFEYWLDSQRDKLNGGGEKNNDESPSTLSTSATQGPQSHNTQETEKT